MSMKRHLGQSFRSQSFMDVHASVPDPGGDADQAGLPAKKVHSSQPVASSIPAPSQGSAPAAIQGESRALLMTRDKDFYFEEGDLVLVVESTVFKVCHLRLVPLSYHD